MIEQQVCAASHELDNLRGVTVYGNVQQIVETLRRLDVSMQDVEFLPSCEWALYVKPGVISEGQSRALRHVFQVAAGRC